MKKVTAIIGGVLLVGAGFGAGFVVGKRAGIKACRAACQEEIDEVREIYRHKCEKKGLDPEIVEKDILDVEPQQEVSVTVAPAAEKKEEPAPKYTEMVQEYGIDDIEEGGIQVITEEEYEETCDPREPVGRHVEISYIGNNRFVHGNGSPADPTLFNSERVVLYFNEGDGTDVVYVHNIDMDTYYLITDDSQRADYLTPKNTGSTHGNFNA